MAAYKVVSLYLQEAEYAQWQAYATAHKLPVSRAIKELAETGRATTLAGGSIASIKVSNDYILRLAAETLMMSRKLLHTQDPASFTKCQEAAHKLYAELTGTGKSG